MNCEPGKLCRNAAGGYAYCFNPYTQGESVPSSEEIDVLLDGQPVAWLWVDEEMGTVTVRDPISRQVVSRHGKVEIKVHWGATECRAPAN